MPIRRVLAVALLAVSLTACSDDGAKPQAQPAAPPTTAAPSPTPTSTPSPTPEPSPTVWAYDPDGAAMCIAVQYLYDTPNPLPAAELAVAGDRGAKSKNGRLRVVGQDLASYARDLPNSPGFRKKVDQVGHDCYDEGYYTKP